MQAFTPAKESPARLADVSAEAKPGVVMTQLDFDRIAQRVKAEVAAKTVAAPEGANATDGSRLVKLRLVFTNYDEGNRFARFMLVGLGQIHIDADVVLVDATSGATLGQYRVSKQFAFGGLYGGATSIEDVEKGFAKSVAEIFTQKT
ncbi:MAG: hypothetical protein JWL84_3756 [Rhodospirillales bacterium]|nr:hypothetical protein [Rhodospirillales bacterium]